MTMVDHRTDRTAAVERQLRALALLVQGMAREVDALWLESVDDGGVTLRIVEASHSLRRASLALGGDTIVGGR
jgi:hypothetical protein